MRKIILQRNFTGNDGWNSFKEIVTIDEERNLNYRSTEGGNNKFGRWKKWKDERRALQFIFGDIELSKKTIEAFKDDCMKHRGLDKKEYNMDCYSSSSHEEHDE